VMSHQLLFGFFVFGRSLEGNELFVGYINKNKIQNKHDFVNLLVFFCICCQ
jgi:hypothetical protein